MNDNSTHVTDDESDDVRILIDADGQRWVVREVEPPRYDRRGRSLIFLSNEAMRRVREYPANWRECSDEELIAVSHRR